MGNDIEIRVRVANNTATGLAAVNRSLNRLRDEARDAGRGLDSLTARAAAATLALRGLRDAAQDASRSLRSLNMAARNADGRLSTLSDRSRTLRRDTDDLDGSMRRLTGTMGGMRGSFGTLRTSSGSAGNSMQRLKTAAIALSPALIPVAASLAPIAAQAGAAGVAVGAFGAAIIGQLVAVKDAADAEKKYQDAIKKHGRSSEEAAKAEADYLSQVRQLDPATRRSAAGLSVLKDQYKAWSKDLAGDTMPVVTKSFAVFGSLLPKLAPTVRATSTELNRLMTVLAGGVNSAGFDRFMISFQEFATGALAKATDGLVHFMRAMSGGAGSGQFTEFMAYVRDVGPQVGETLANLARALTHLVAAASETGVSLLAVVNAFAGLVNAIPTGVLSTMLQLAVAFKVVRLAAAGLAGAGGGVTGFVASLTAMRVAAAGAGGGLAGLAAGFGALSRAAKLNLVAVGIGLAVVAISKLSKLGQAAPPNVDKLTNSLQHLALTGKVTGEASRVFGADLDGLYDKVRNITDPSVIDQIQNGFVKIFTFGQVDSTASKNAQEALDAIDDGLVKLVKGGNADLAAAALKHFSDEYAKSGKPVSDFRGQMDEYNDALKDLKFEQELAASAMGLFGEQALATQAKLNAQKQSADGLRQAIQALNDQARAGLGGMIGFEAAIDNAMKAARENAGALHYVNGELDLNSEKARAVATSMQDLAAKTEEAAYAEYQRTGKWESAIKVYDRGREQLIAAGLAARMSRTEAEKFADTYLNIKDFKKVRLEMNSADAKKDLEAFNAVVKKTPGSKSVTLKTLSQGAEQILESFGLKVKRLPDGRVTITTANGQALKGIGDVNGALGRLPRSRTINITIKHFTQRTQRIITEYQTKYLSGRSQHDVTGATGGLYTGKAFRYAGGGLVQGPGSGTSDDVFAPWLSNGEFVMKKAAVDRYGEKFMQLLNDGRLDMPRFAKGGKVSKQAKAESEARRDAWSDLTVSHFGRMAGYSRSEFGSALGKPDSVGALVSALSQWRGIIMKATHGGTENRLLKQLDSTGRKLLGWEKQLGSVTKSLEKARGKLDSLRDAAHSLAGSVKSGILGSANITRGVSSGGTATVAGIMGGLTASRDKATAFSGALSQLKKKGLSSSLLRQIAEAGIEGGGLETAGALLGASGSEIQSLNDLQSQIGKSAKSAGKTTADAVYGKAIREQAKTVAKLEKSQDKLRHSMDKLARSMEKALERAFGRKAAGGIVGAAASGGIRGGLTWVGEHEPELLQLPIGSRVWSGPDSRRKAGELAAPWASMLNTPRRGAAGPAAPGGRAQEVKVVLEIRAGDNNAYSNFLVQEIQRAVRRNGSIEATFKPPRGR